VLLALDPGMNSPGVALFVPNTPGLMLRHATRLVIPESFAALPDGARWLRVAHEIASWANARGAVQTVVFERPQWYQRGKSKGDPNQLAGVAGVAANVTGILSTHEPIAVLSPTPSEWIGQVSKVCPACNGKKTEPAPMLQQMMDNTRKKPKRVKRVCVECHNSAWGTPRGRRIWSRLSEAERALCPDQNDAIDAVGIGLWALGRLEKISVFSNGRDGR
jgi:hypothetical protein